MSDMAQQLTAARERLQDQAGSPRYLTIPEVAELARCEHKAVRKAVHDGVLPAFSPSRRLLIRESDAVRWVEARPVRISDTRPRPRTPTRSRARQMPGNVQQLRDMERDLT